MADNRKRVSALATVAVVALELLEENDDELEVDTFSELVFITVIIKDRRKAVRVQGYVDVLLRYTISDFRSHFRLSTGTFEGLTLDLGNYLSFSRLFLKAQFFFVAKGFVMQYKIMLLVV